MTNTPFSIIEVRCSGCGQVVFESVILRTDTPTEIDRYPTTYVTNAKLKDNAPRSCTDGNPHRVDLLNLM